jgi:hypothetical protein
VRTAPHDTTARDAIKKTARGPGLRSGDACDRIRTSFKKKMWKIRVKEHGRPDSHDHLGLSRRRLDDRVASIICNLGMHRGVALPPTAIVDAKRGGPSFTRLTHFIFC